MAFDKKGTLVLNGISYSGSGGSSSDKSVTRTTSPLTDSADGTINAITLKGNSYKSKNLLDMNNHLSDTFIDGNTSKIMFASGADTYFIKVKKNTYYSFYKDKGDRTIILGTTEEPQTDVVGELLYNRATHIPFVTVNSGNNEYIAYYTNRNQEDKPSKIMVTEGTESHDYEPYGIIIPSGDVVSQNADKTESSTIHTDRPLLSVNDIRNELIIDKYGNGKFIKRVGTVDLSEENWTYISATNQESFACSPTSFDVANKNGMLCSAYDTKSIGGWTDLAQFDNCIVRHPSVTNNIRIKDTSLSGNVTDLVNKLKNVDFIYELATPTEIILDASEIAHILSLKTFDGNTYIDTDGCPFEITYNVNETIGTLYDKTEDLQKQIDEIGEIYSEEETKIGTYLGKPLYRKVLNVIATSATYQTDISNMNIKYLVDVYGTSEEGAHLPFSHPTSSYNISLFASPSTLQLITGSSMTNAIVSRNTKVILEYTKLSD